MSTNSAHIKVAKGLINSLSGKEPEVANIFNRLLTIMENQDEKIEELENETGDLSRRKLNDPNYDNDY